MKTKTIKVYNKQGELQEITVVDWKHYLQLFNEDAIFFIIMYGVIIFIIIILIKITLQIIP